MQRRKKALIVLSVLLIVLVLVSLFSVWLTSPSLIYQSFRDNTDRFSVLSESDPVEMIPVSSDFSLLIPSINLNVPVIPNVDGGNPREYLWRVTQGVAHFKHREFSNVIVDGAFPGEEGNIFLFGHSQVPLGDTSNFQGVFNNLSKLLPGDEVRVVYNDTEFRYKVVEGKVVSKKALEYLEATPEETLTLMTCWPLGLDIQRYIVRAKRVSG